MLLSITLSLQHDGSNFDHLNSLEFLGLKVYDVGVLKNSISICSAVFISAEQGRNWGGKRECPPRPCGISLTSIPFFFVHTIIDQALNNDVIREVTVIIKIYNKDDFFGCPSAKDREMQWK